MSNEKTTSNYPLRWRNELRDQYKQLARDHGMTVHAYLMMVLNDHVRKNHPKRQQPLIGGDGVKGTVE